MIDILLATYNSEKFLEEQIVSIFEQDYGDWKLLIRDGGSKDNTVKMLKHFRSLHPGRIKCIPAHGRTWACENFAALLSSSSAPYVMFSDHDDIWCRDKISKSLETIENAEARFGVNMPIMVFSDMYVVDKDNRIKLCDSYYKYQKLVPSRLSLNYLLVQNIPCGCTLLTNRALVDLVGEISPAAVMHDHWLSLVAAGFGKIIYLDRPTLYYRQHENNVSGAAPYGWKYFYRKYYQGLNNLREHFFLYTKQAKAFQQRYGEKLSLEKRVMLEEFIAMKEASWLERREILFRHKIYKSGWRRNIGMMLIV